MTNLLQLLLFKFKPQKNVLKYGIKRRVDDVTKSCHKSQTYILAAPKPLTGQVENGVQKVQVHPQFYKRMSFEITLHMNFIGLCTPRVLHLQLPLTEPSLACMPLLCAKMLWRGGIATSNYDTAQLARHELMPNIQSFYIYITISTFKPVHRPQIHLQ